MVKKFGPAYGPVAKKAIKAMIASGAVVKVGRGRGRPSKVSNNVKNYVKKAIDREIQDKEEVNSIFSVAGGATTGLIRGYGIDSTSANYGITTTNSIVPIIVFGTDEDKRVGNSIRPKSLVARYVINATALSNNSVTSTNKQFGMPFYVSVLFYNRKDTKTNSTNDTIKDNGSASTDFTTIFDHLTPWNKDMYNILSYKRYKMYPSQQKEIVGTTEVTTQLPSINGCVPMVMRSQKLKLPAKLVYDDATQQPSNARIYCAVGVFNIDNSDPDRSSTVRATITMTTHMKYQNA